MMNFVSCCDRIRMIFEHNTWKGREFNSQPDNKVRRMRPFIAVFLSIEYFGYNIQFSMGFEESAAKLILE